MSAALKRPMTLEAFLAWDRKQEMRYEFDGFGPVAINGGTLLHSKIASRMERALEGKLAGRHCEVFHGDVKVAVAVNGRIRYPDVVVTCTAFSCGATIFSRSGGDWAGHVVVSDGRLALPALCIDVMLDEIYGDLVLPDDDD